MPRTSASEVFRNANFSLFFSAQLISHTGMWFQNLTLALIVVERTASASALAYVTVAQFTPMLLLAGVAGKVADAVSPRKVLVATAACSALVACGLGGIVSLPEADLLWVYALVVLGGCVSAFERIGAQAFIYELVGGDLLKNAVVLNTVAVSVARSVGPGLAGLVYLVCGPVVCLCVTAGAFAIVTTLMLLIRASKLTPRRRGTSEMQSIRGVFREIRQNLDLRVVLVINVVVTLAVLSMNVVLTAAVSITFEGDAGDLGLMHVLNAIGATIGGYLLTRTDKISAATLGAALLGLSVSLAVAASAQSLTWFLIVAPVLGAAIGIYQAVLQSSAQTASPPEMLGRTMSLVAMGNFGLLPFSALLMGLLIDATSSHEALMVGAVASFVCAAAVYLTYRRRR